MKVRVIALVVIFMGVGSIVNAASYPPASYPPASYPPGHISSDIACQVVDGYIDSNCENFEFFASEYPNCVEQEKFSMDCYTEIVDNGELLSDEGDR